MTNNKIKFEVKRDSLIKKEVSNTLFIPVINAIKEKGLAFKDFLIGTPYDESYFLNKRERVEWWVYCKIISNMRSHFTLEDFEGIGADFVRRGLMVIGLVGFFLFSSRKISKLFADKILQRITSHVLGLKLMQIEFIGAKKIIFTLLVGEEYEHMPEFAYGNKGVIKELGILSGLKDCKVDLQLIPNGAIYEMTWKKENIFFRIRRGFRWLFSINKAFWELTDSNEELLKEYEKLEDYKNNLEIKVEERTAELKKANDQLSETIDLLQEAREIQSRFFTNISHEFRTPLTLILGPVKQIIERTEDEKVIDELKIVQRNAKRLLVLVNQLLDISKLESGSMKLQACSQDIVPIIKAQLQSFCSYAERKKINLKFNSLEDEIILLFDKDKIEKIITNILSNAFKFTPDDCSIEVAITKGEEYIDVTISDTGIGIPEEMIPKIFDRFYQVDGSHTKETEGTGIGLSLTKELVELHKGKIEVKSKEGKGTTFTISLPLGKKHLKPEEILETSASLGDSHLIPDEMFIQEKTNTDFSKYLINGKGAKPLLLIIEDNFDVRNYIKNNLKADYKIFEAADGLEGWNKSIEQIPDLIISDVMMPKMDGFRLCNKLKSDERTSHIPIILLTAKATTDDKITGFETGADDYIIKPFDTEELKARIKNLIDQRERIHEHFRKNGLFEIDEVNITPVDYRFLQRTITNINEHISDSSFSVEKLAENMAVSRSLLLRKIEALIGEPPIELIKSTRMHKAAKLIESIFGNISEIALEVGFNNPSYFAECFKKQFGVTPTQYHRNMGNLI
ncbi:MAG: hybrid sensor histidine kinase/response regulator transcription factor [Ignavibacteriaceae bacterium]